MASNTTLKISKILANVLKFSSALNLSPAYFSDFTPCHSPSIRYTPATLSFVFPKHVKHLPALETLHKLFLLSVMLLP